MRTKWEYKRNTRNGVMTTSELNEYGEDGWELISISKVGTVNVHIFKRQVC